MGKLFFETTWSFRDCHVSAETSISSSAALLPPERVDERDDALCFTVDARDLRACRQLRYR